MLAMSSSSASHSVVPDNRAAAKTVVDTLRAPVVPPSSTHRAPIPTVDLVNSSLASMFTTEMIKKSIQSKNHAVEALSPAAFASANGHLLLEYQMRMMLQQEQQNRLFAAMKAGHQQHSMRMHNGNGMANNSPAIDLRLLQLRQMMETNRVQQMRRQPGNGRASAA
jgi:hypothetical protein